MSGIAEYLPALSAVVLGIVFVLVVFQEAINGFHDTANAVATVIYSNSMKPLHAVLLSAVCNFLGVMVGGTAVAFALVYLLPVGMVASISNEAEAAFLLALIVTAVAWNFATWWYGIPNSTTHTYVGSFLGVNMAYAFIQGEGVLDAVNWHEGEKVLAALLLSPVLGFVLAMIVYFIVNKTVRDERMHQPPEAGAAPPAYIRGTLIFGAAGVSLLHGSNDGQKSIGLMMLILIGLMPAAYGIDRAISQDTYMELDKAVDQAVQVAQPLTQQPGLAEIATDVVARARDAAAIFDKYTDMQAIPDDETQQIREDMLYLQSEITQILKQGQNTGVLTDQQVADLTHLRSLINEMTENVPIWIILISATALGVGTAIGYKRIVLTLGEKIGGTHMNAAQGTSAQLTAMACIGLADATGAPVSTTHVLSSGVAGAMVASKAGLQMSTLRKIVITWFTTLPGTMMLSFALAILFHAAMV